MNQVSVEANPRSNRGYRAITASLLFATVMAIVPLTVDSQYRFNRSETFTVSGSGLAILFSEPATLLLSQVTRALGAESGRPLQILLAAICFSLIYNVLDRSLAWSSIALLYPPVYLLVFNIQGAGIAYLGAYLLLKKKHWRLSEILTARSAIIVFILLMFHVSVLLIFVAFGLAHITRIFISLRLSKREGVWWLLIACCLPLTALSLSDFAHTVDFMTVLFAKLEAYSQSGNSRNYSNGSLLHLSLGGMVLLALSLLSFRGRLSPYGLTVLYLSLMIFLSAVVISLKFSSRLMFALDVHMILALLTLLKARIQWLGTPTQRKSVM